MPDFAKCFFVRYAQIYEAYVERTLICIAGGKTVAKVGAREIPRVHLYYFIRTKWTSPRQLPKFLTQKGLATHSLLTFIQTFPVNL